MTTGTRSARAHLSAVRWYVKLPLIRDLISTRTIFEETRETNTALITRRSCNFDRETKPHIAEQRSYTRVEFIQFYSILHNDFTLSDCLLFAIFCATAISEIKRKQLSQTLDCPLQDCQISVQLIFRSSLMFIERSWESKLNQFDSAVRSAGPAYVVRIDVESKWKIEQGRRSLMIYRLEEPFGEPSKLLSRGVAFILQSTVLSSQTTNLVL